MKNRIRKLIALVLSGAMLLGLGGCGKGDGASGQEEGKATLGRYLESELPMPSAQGLLMDMNFLEDGTLRASFGNGGGNPEIWDTQDLGETWKKNEGLTQALAEANPQQAWMDNVVIGSGGEVAYSVLSIPEDVENMEDSQLFVGVVDEGGNRTDLSGKITGSDLYPQLMRMEFTQDGGLMVQGFQDYLKLFDFATGQERQTFDGEEMVTFSLIGDTLFVVKSGGVELYDWASGEPLETDQVLQDQILSNERNLQITTTSSLPITAAPGEEAGSMFYCTSEGIFSHVLEGSVSEKVVDGALCSLSSSVVGFKRLLVKDQEFYVGILDDTNSKILRYTYSADTPTVPATTLKIYSLAEDDYLRQLIPAFQKKYPEVYVDYQVGMTGEDGVTLTDALKNLNTEIMAGKGPDVLLLDGIQTEPYVERGMLADIRDVIKEVDQEEGLLDNVVGAYEEEKGVFLFPSRIGLPVILGREEELSSVRDIASFAEAALAMDEKNPQTEVLTPYLSAQSLVTVLNQTVSPAWLDEEGGVQEDALRAFMEQMAALYNMEDHTVIEEEMASYGGELSSYRLPGLDVMTVYAGLCQTAYGVLGGPDEFASVCQVNQELGTVLQPFGDREGGVFLPAGMLGVNSQSSHLEEAKGLVRYLLSSEAQKSVRFGGFAVNETALADEEGYWSRNGEEFSSGVTFTDEDGTVVDAMLSVENLSSQEIEEAVRRLETPRQASPYQYLLLETVNEQTVAYLLGDAALDEAVENVLKTVKLYLAEQ